jgi:hypothetical protein
MLILDLNQVMISNIMNQIGNHTNTEIEEDLVRHMVLNTIRSLIVKYGHEYGELVIACDDKKYWRREFFPHYKANRKKTREASDIDWGAIFNCLNKIRDELKEYFPYKVIQVEGAEADDIIGTLCFEYGTILNSEEKILILSGDKDFVQLHVFANVKQYDPIRKKFIEHANPSLFLKEHILKGDSGDGIPNILSPHDCFVNGDRQKPLTAKKIQSFIQVEDIFKHEDSMIRTNYSRNATLIDLRHIPSTISKNILDQYESQKSKGREKLFNYFIHHRLKLLMEHINEF